MAENVNYSKSINDICMATRYHSYLFLFQFHRSFMQYQETLLRMKHHTEKMTDFRNKKLEKLVFEQNLYVNEARLLCDVEAVDERENHVKRR